MAIHWCGTGLSAIPGLKKLILDGNNVIVWNRTVSKAKKARRRAQVASDRGKNACRGSRGRRGRCPCAQAR